ncbi:MAG: reverse transcriptase family protein, partial [Pseudomonadota bacterium]
QYEEVQVEEVVNNCTHLSTQQRDDLLQVLKRYPTLFNGQLGRYTDKTVHLEVDPSVKPRSSKAYTIPHKQLDVFKQELDRLEKIGVFEKCGRSEWISGTFIIPKKDSRIRWITDFRALNKALKRKVYPMPIISDILARRPGYKFLTKLDISMHYYTLELDDSSKELTTFATPFGLYRYRRLPMGISCAPDIAQDVMVKVLEDFMKDIEIYIDDIACFSNDWPSHLQLLTNVLQ